MSKERKQKIVMVTGGAGYIGSTLLHELLRKGFRVVCVDNLRFGSSSLNDVSNNEKFVLEKIDITDRQAVDDVLKSQDFYAVIHLAAIVGDPACRLDPALAIETNKDASIDLLQTVIQRGIKRFIFASTCSNYGKMKDSTGFVDENAQLAPISLYAELKVAFEDLFLNRIEKSDTFCPTSLRFSTVYGLSPRMRFDLTVNEFTKELALGRELLVYGEQFWRPYCHVNDIARAVIAVLNAPESKVAYRVFNVGDTTQNYTKQMIVDELLRQIPAGQVKYVRKEEDPRDYRVDFSRIRKELGLKARKTVSEGITDILTGIKDGTIKNPDDQKYYNIPTT